ncbi:MAG: flavin reductase family protein [Chloroflexi bacterium]|nr:flavin reductase family protein [Chloroflexota bacterium]
MRVNLTEHDARRLLVPGPVVLLTTKWRAAQDVMAAAWTTPLSAVPPFVGVCVHPSRHTHDMIRFSEEFALNIAGPRLLNHAAYFGSVSGRDADKLDLSKLPTFRARKVEAPLLEGCVGHIECGLEDAIRLGDHTLFVGRVLAVSAEDTAYNEMWLLDDPDERPLHYLGGFSYAALECRLEARAPAPANPDFASEWERAAREIEERAAGEHQN